MTRRRIRIVGLTGGIASGKSAVAALLAAKGVPTLDADELAREAVRPGTEAHRAVAKRWPEFIGPDEAIDRAALGRHVFAHPAELRELTALTVPRILALFQAAVSELESRDVPVCVLQAPTLFEENLDTLVDGALLVSLPEEEQLQRLLARGGLDETEARRRIASQLPLEAKRARARWVIDNSGSPEALAARMDALWDTILRELSDPTDGRCDP